MVKVRITAEAMEQWNEMPLVIHSRVQGIIDRLAKWPAISGAKPLRHNLVGHYRIRTGAYRVQFRVEGDVVIVEKIGKRDGYYED